MAEVEKRSKGTDAPKCKVCEKRHWGTCANQTSGGYLATTTMGAAPAAKVTALKKAVAKAAAVPAKKPKKARKP